MKKFKEIGSNFYADNIQVSSELDEQIIKAKYSFAKNILYPSLGRNAILIILQKLKLNRGVVLLPGYTCESVIEPFVSENYKLVFYSFHDDLTINLDDLESKISDYNPNVILIHGFYGQNTFLSANPLIQLARKKGSIVIQDDTQTVFSEIDMLSVDYYIGSIRKWMEIPDGAYICSSQNLPIISNSNNDTFIDLVTKAQKLKSDYVNNLDKNLKQQYKRLFLDAQNIIDNDLTVYSMTDLSKGILNNYDLALMKTQRVENYNYLFKNILNKFEGIRPVFPNPVTNNVCPIYFPLFVDNREEFQHILSESDIYATIIWPKSVLIEGINEETDSIYNRIIGIPCDQRYSVKDMQRVIYLMNSHF